MPGQHPYTIRTGGTTNDAVTSRTAASFWAQLNALREQAGFTQGEVATIAGLSGQASAGAAVGGSGPLQAGDGAVRASESVEG